MGSAAARQPHVSPREINLLQFLKISCKSKQNMAQIVAIPFLKKLFQASNGFKFEAFSRLTRGCRALLKIYICKIK